MLFRLLSHSGRKRRTRKYKRRRSGSVSQILSTLAGCVAIFLPVPENRTSCEVQLIPGAYSRQSDPTPVCLASRGVYHASIVTSGAVGSYPTFSPLPVRAVCFLWHFPSTRHWLRVSPAFAGHAALRCPDFPLHACAQRPPEPERRSKTTPDSVGWQAKMHKKCPPRFMHNGAGWLRSA